MANETSSDFAGAINNLVETLGKLGQMQVDLVTNGIKSVVSAVEPLGKNATDLAGGVVNTLNEALKNVTSAIAPKQ
jgi:chlorosome envelope protein B